ncbi:MAG: DUF1501 domain-containing protein [Planctomycetota bacterium]
MFDRSPNRAFSCGRTRRQFLWEAGNGFFGTALAGLLARDLTSTSSAHAESSPNADSDPSLAPLQPRGVHFPARAKACIFLYMTGGPSHMDTFDPKPELSKRHGQNHRFASRNTFSQKPSGTLKGSPFKFSRYGDGSLQISELLPHLSTCASDVAAIRSMTADSAAHGAASILMNTGSLRQGFPSLGSWSVYGLGSVNQNLPGFVVLVNGAPYAGAKNWSSGFMPSAFQGTEFRAGDQPIENLRPASGASALEQRRQLDLLQELNRAHGECAPGNSELAARISAYELAYRMQSHAPEVVDMSSEKESTLDMYGIRRGKRSERFGRSCLLARRLVERGVRFVEIFHSNWDTHGNNDQRHRDLCGQVDQPMAGLVKDLKQRGLLEDTLVVWGGEFGRTPIGGKDPKGGRDHHAAAFSMWMAGGGVRGGISYGRTDDLGYGVVENRVHVHDLHATILHLMGIDHERLTYFHQGRNFRLTDVFGEVVHDIIA